VTIDTLAPGGFRLEIRLSADRGETALPGAPSGLNLTAAPSRAWAAKENRIWD